MRVVLVTNILISARLVQTGHSTAIYRAWQEGYFTLMVCAEQLDELRATLRKPAIAVRVKPYQAGRLINQLRRLADTVDALPRVRRSPDPTDDYLLGLAEAGAADLSGDRRQKRPADARPSQNHQNPIRKGLRRIIVLKNLRGIAEGIGHPLGTADFILDLTPT